MPKSPDNLLTIDLGAVVHNYRTMAAWLPEGILGAAVVKADAYGHGAVEVSRALKRAGIPCLAVAVLCEAQELRAGGVDGPILVLTGIRPGQASIAVEMELTPFIFNMDQARELSQAAVAYGMRAKAHLKVDTGMSRLGVRPEEALEFLRAARELPGLTICGLATHLATAGDPDTAYASRQAQRFGDLLYRARQEGFELPASSLSPTGAVLRPVPGGFSPPGLARMGISLYGGLADPSLAPMASELRQAMRFSSLVVDVKTLAEGTPVSYGCTYTLTHRSTLAVIPVGYADGYPRSLSNRGQVLINGRRCPIRGRVCMNMFMAEVPADCPPPKLGDEVVLLGRQGGENISLGEVAEAAGTIPYEIACALGPANRREFLPA